MSHAIYPYIGADTGWSKRTIVQSVSANVNEKDSRNHTFLILLQRKSGSPSPATCLPLALFEREKLRINAGTQVYKKTPQRTCIWSPVKTTLVLFPASVIGVSVSVSSACAASSIKMCEKIPRWSSMSKRARHIPKVDIMIR